MEDFKERQKLAWQGMFYGLQRIDLLIISISGAGIYTVLETLKYLNDKKICVPGILKLSGIFLLIAIVLNVISQFMGYKSNEKDFLMCQVKIDAKGALNEKQQEEHDKHDSLADRYDWWTNILNFTSPGIMILGLIFLIIYYTAIF